MMTDKKAAFLWFAAGLVLSGLVLFQVLDGLSGKVTVIGAEEIPSTVNSIMRCIQNEEWESLQLLTDGSPKLTPFCGETNTAEARIWDAYLQSLQWDCDREFEVQNSHVNQRVRVTSLDITETTAMIVEILQESSEGSEEINKPLTAAEQVLAGNTPTTQHEITISLVRREGQWKMIPNQALLSLMSGFSAD